MNTPLNDDNFMLFAMQRYTNPQCKNIDEFHEDLNRIKYIKRLLMKYNKKGELRERLIINHIIILANVFKVENCVRMLMYKIEEEYHSVLKTFLIYLNYIPEDLEKIPEVDIEKIPLDNRVVDALRKI